MVTAVFSSYSTPLSTGRTIVATRRSSAESFQGYCEMTGLDAAIVNLHMMVLALLMDRGGAALSERNCLASED